MLRCVPNEISAAIVCTEKIVHLTCFVLCLSIKAYEPVMLCQGVSIGFNGALLLFSPPTSAFCPLNPNLNELCLRFPFPFHSLLGRDKIDWRFLCSSFHTIHRQTEHGNSSVETNRRRNGIVNYYIGLWSFKLLGIDFVLWSLHITWQIFFEKTSCSHFIGNMTIMCICLIGLIRR